MSSLKSDITYTHSKNLGEVVGDFCGTPIQELLVESQREDRTREVRRNIKINEGLSSTTTAEVLPGEIICEDYIIRRGTAAEANPEFYNWKQPPNTQVIPIESARSFSQAGAMVRWRPNGVIERGKEIALVHEV